MPPPMYRTFSCSHRRDNAAHAPLPSRQRLALPPCRLPTAPSERLPVHDRLHHLHALRHRAGVHDLPECHCAIQYHGACMAPVHVCTTAVLTAPCIYVRVAHPSDEHMYVRVVHLVCAAVQIFAGIEQGGGGAPPETIHDDPISLLGGGRGGEPWLLGRGRGGGRSGGGAFTPPFLTARLPCLAYAAETDDERC